MGGAGGSGETHTSHVDEGSNEEITESLGDLPDLSTMSSAFRTDTNALQQSLSYRRTSGPLAINNCDPVGLVCERDTTNLLNETDDLGYNNNGDASGGSHPIAGAMMIINACLGAGLLNFPSAFHEAGGVVAGNLVQLVSFLWRHHIN